MIIVIAKSAGSALNEEGFATVDIFRNDAREKIAGDYSIGANRGD
jgi:hypothetical protein